MEEYRKKDDRGRSKALRLTKNDPHSKVDSSTWTPDEAENAGVKTGARPLVKRLFKKGGKVIGADAMKRADRKPRKAGGRTENDRAHRYLTPDNLINRDVRMANDEREGVKHVGAFKKGGAAKYGKGGRMPLEGHSYHKKTDAELRYISKDAAEAARAMKGMDSKAEGKYLDQVNDAQTILGHRQRTGNGPESGMNKGGRTHKLGGGIVGDNPVSVADRSESKAAGLMNKGGRAKKARGGPEGDFSSRNENADELTQMINNMGSKMPMDSNYAKVPMPPRRPADAPIPPTGPIPDLAKKMGAKKGGSIHSDEAQDKKLMHKVLKPAVFKAKGGAAHGEHCGCERCHGGRTMKYGGGGVFSGNSTTKIPGATGGRKARASGGGFGEAFKAGRAAMLAGGPKTFEYNGKMYTTDLAAPATKSAPPSRSAGKDMMPASGPQEKIVGTPIGGRYDPTQSITQPSARTQNYSLPFVHMGGAGEPAIVFGSSKADQDYNLAGNADLNPGFNGPSVDEMRQSDARGGRTHHAKGGRTKAGKTTINIVMGGHGQQPQNYPNAPVQPPRPPMGVPVPPPATAGGAPMMPPQGMPPQMPPQMPRATGGRTGKMVGGSLGNAGGMAPQMGMGQQPMMQQQPMIQQPMGMGYPMPRKSGGRTGYPIDSGAGGGNARLEKIEAYGLKPSKRK